jgi:hypothetical protein
MFRYVHMHVCTCVHMLVCCMHLSLDIYRCICMDVYIFVHVHKYVCMHLCLYVHMHMYICTQIYSIVQRMQVHFT